MSLLKDDRTIRLDELQLAGDEALELYAATAESAAEPGAPAWRARVAAHEQTQRALLTRIAEHRRALGEQPQAGDPEWPTLESAGVRLRAAVAPNAASDPFAETLSAAARRLHDAIDAARGSDLDETLRALTLELRRDVDALLDMLPTR